MNDRINRALQALLDPVGSHRREVLLEIEHQWEPDEIKRFAGIARALDVATSMEMCGVLAGATAGPLVELLGHYADSNEAALRHRALEALENVPGPRRIHSLVRMLGSKTDEVVAGACRLLGGSGDRGVQDDLVKVLGRSNKVVVRAGISALRQLGCDEAVPALTKLLTHGEPAVRELTIEALVELGDEHTFPGDQVVVLLAGDDTVAVRAKAAWALGVRPQENCRTALLKSLLSDPDITTRCAAARALSAYANAEVVRTLLHKCARSSQMALSLACRRALDSMDEATVLAACQEILGSNDTASRIETAATLGKLSFAAASKVLSERLKIEEDPVVKASLIEAIGSGGWQDQWDTVRKHTRDESMVAFAAVTALGNLLVPSRLNDFATLIDEQPEETLREAVIARLVLYGRTKGLPASLRRPLVPLLAERGARVSTVAAEALGYVNDPLVVSDVLGAIDEERDGEFIDVAAAAVMRRLGGRVHALLDTISGDQLRAAAAIIQRLKNLGDDAQGVCMRLATLVVESGEDADKADSAEAALYAAAVIEPEALGRVLTAATGKSAFALVNAWRRLSEAARKRAPVDLVKLLHAPDASLRAAALDALDNAPDSFVPLVVDMALGDGDEQVRQRARVAVKRLVGA